LGARRDDIWFIKEEFEDHSLVGIRADTSCDQEVDVTLGQLEDRCSCRTSGSA
jgi:hypothetical protein